jgi:DNA-binding transcriptional LysR family regulator
MLFCWVLLAEAPYMRIQNVDLNLFVVFEAVYNERNLTRAAEVLCITQPAVSNALNRLRKNFDDQLFVRTAKGMVPTPVADNIVGRVREALQLMEAAVTEGDVFDPATSDKAFSLSMNDISENVVLSPLMQAIQQQAPGVSLHCFTVPRDNIEKELAAGTLDLAIDVPTIATPQLCNHNIVRERYVCALRKDHPLVGESLTFDDYLTLGHIHVSSRRQGQGYVDIALNRLGRQRKIQLRVTRYQEVATIVQNSDLAMTVPLGLAKQFDLKIMELPFPLPNIESNLYWHKSADLDQANQWLRQLILEAFKAVEA